MASLVNQIDGGQARPKRKRAKSPEKKAEVRAKLIAVGRRLFAEEDASTVSLRRIAEASGFTPSTIYTYFADQQELFAAIREYDMSAATSEFERIAATTNDPIERVRAVFSGVVRHWLEYPDHFEVLFSQRAERVPHRAAPGPAFGMSTIATRSYALYRNVIADLFDTYPKHPIPIDVATDSMIAATHGIILFMRHTASMKWSDPEVVAATVIGALLRSWETERSPKSPGPTPPRAARRTPKS
jgi:AcrR family transcriptional regulator